MPRPRLDRRLDVLLDPEQPVRTVLVSAPAGFGKTTLLAGWARRASADGWSVAWCSLDETDASCFRMWSSLLAALEAVAPPGVATRLRTLSAPRAAGDADFAADLIEALAGSPVVLVLENVHEVTDHDALRDLDYFVGHRPSGMPVVVSSRYEPPLVALQSARVGGRLADLTTADLAFRVDEVAEMFPELSDGDARAVWEPTEGWPALVRLLALAPSEELGHRLDEVTADGDLAGYLFRETFGRQSARTQRILLITSVPDSVTADLAVLLTGHDRAAQVLDDGTRASGLITRTWHSDTDVTTYRMHPLLRTYLRGELQRTDPQAERQAHRTAALWLLRTGQLLPAVHHASASGVDYFLDHVARAAGPALINAGEGGLLIDALADPRPGGEPGRPWARLVRAAALIEAGRLPEAACEVFPVGAVGGLYLSDSSADSMELVAAWHAIDVHLRRRQGLPSDPHQLAEEIEIRDPDLRVLLALHRGATLLRQGQFDASRTELETGLALARGLGRMAAVIDCLTFLAGVHAATADQARLVERADEALRLGEANGWAHSPRMAYAHLLRSLAHHQALQDGLAAWHAARAMALDAPSTEPTVRVSVHAVHAALATRTGLVRDKRHGSLHEIVLGSTAREVGPMTVVLAAYLDMHESVRIGRPDLILEVIGTVSARLGDCGELVHMTAVHAASQGRRAEARTMLATLLDGHEDGGSSPRMAAPVNLVEALASAATLAHLDADHVTARRHALAAVDVAQRLGCHRPLVDAGPDFAELLAAGRGGWGHVETLVDTVLAYERTVVRTLPALTARELELVRRMDSLETVEDIADSLHVSVNTVKTHLRSIYRKLDVNSRRDAVATARRAGVL